MAQRPGYDMEAFLSDKYQYIVAIDIGTLNSGYAYASKSEINFEAGEVTVQFTQCWYSGTPGYMPFKTPTTILLTKDGELVSFGFEALDRFANIIDNNKQSEYLLFTNFKMALYDTNITPDLNLTDVQGGQLSAKQVFGKSILAMMEAFFKNMKKTGIENLNRKAVRYVLTVPAIWSDAAKQIMRQSANVAGIEDKQLLIALEPEAASVHCQYIKAKSVNETEPTVPVVGTRYVVADLGGGTADISVHEKLENGHLKELHRSRGDKCGGDSINYSFVRQISKIFSFELMTKVMEKYPLIYWEVNNAFEAAKIKFGGTQANQMTVKLPMMFLQDFFRKETGKDLIQEIKLDRYKGAVTIKHGDHICVEKAYAENNLFKPTTDKVVKLLKSIISEVEGNPYKTISKIILVGGLSGSMYIQDAVREAFPDKHVITPESSQLCVLKGAVLFGRKPELISYRVMRFTYGISTYELFDPKKHEEKRKETLNGVDYCTQIFTRYAEIGTTVEVNTPITRRLSTAYPRQKKISFPIYTSPTCKPNYVDDEGCQKIGEMTIEISDPIEEKKYFNVSLICGNTELRIYAKDITNTTDYTAKLDFLMH